MRQTKIVHEWYGKLKNLIRLPDADVSEVLKTSACNQDVRIVV